MEFTPTHQSDHIQAEESFSIISFIFSPMILLSVFSLFLLFLMPKLMEGLDAEEMKELSRTQSNTASMISGADLSNKLSNALSGRR